MADEASWVRSFAADQDSVWLLATPYVRARVFESLAQRFRYSASTSRARCYWSEDTTSHAGPLSLKATIIVVSTKQRAEGVSGFQELKKGPPKSRPYLPKSRPPSPGSDRHPATLIPPSPLQFYTVRRVTLMIN